jgi:hypothetical protein
MDSRLPRYGEPTDRTMQLLQRYLEAHPENRNTTLAIETISPLMGGLKSDYFILPGEEHLAPEMATHIDLSQIALGPKDLTGFADAFEHMEKAALARYPATLESVRQHISATKAGNQQVNTIFVPDVVSYSADGYFRRLTRLAQDVNCHVVIQTYDGYETPDEAPRYRTVQPPRATSVEDYWRRFEREQPFPLKRLPREPDWSETLEALRGLGPSPAYDQDQDAILQRYRIAAASSPTCLREILLTSPRPSTVHSLDIFKDVAYRHPSDRTLRGYARQVLAKVGTLKNRKVLIRELRKQEGDYDYEDNLMVPLGIYMHDDDDLRQAFMHDLREWIAGEEPNKHRQLIHTIGALYYSFRPDVGLFMTSYLDGELPDRGKDYYYLVIGSILRWLPMYINVMRSAPDGAAVVDIAEQRIAHLLSTFMNGGYDHLDGVKLMWNMGDRTKAATVLSTALNPYQYQKVLKQNLMQVFEQHGGILESSSAYDGGSPFIRHYQQYRNLFGDLPEINRLIHLTGEA